MAFLGWLWSTKGSFFAQKFHKVKIHQDRLILKWFVVKEDLESKLTKFCNFSEISFSANSSTKKKTLNFKENVEYLPLVVDNELVAEK